MLDCTVILRSLLLCLALFLVCQPASAQTDSEELLNHYSEAREYCIVLVNELRMEHGLSPLRQDPLASELALQHATDMAGQDYFSHWDMQGRKPTRRFNLLGGMHGLGENIFYSEYQRGNWREFIEMAMQTLEQSSTHLETMLDPAYTHVGIGMAVEGERFYLAQEFISRAGGNYECRLDASIGDVVEFSGRIDTSRYSFNYIVLRHEALPEERERLWLDRTGSYSEGDSMFAVYTPHRNRDYADVDTLYDVNLDERGNFDSRILLDFKGRPGTYYLILFLHDSRTGSEVRAASVAVEVLR